MEIRTIKQSKHISAQGVYVKTLENGKIVIKVDGKELIGDPVNKEK
jgi:hypothetical protein